MDEIIYNLEGGKGFWIMTQNAGAIKEKVDQFHHREKN